MTEVWYLTRRNVKLFFKDKGMFFSSLITPMILLVLYVTFLYSVYRDSFTSNIPEGIKISDGIISVLFLKICKTKTAIFFSNGSIIPQ